MSKRFIFLLIALFIVATASGIYVWQTSLKDTLQERAIEKVVRSFGEQLENVSLLTDPEVASASITEHYSSFISHELLRKWQADPTQAPGRATSSPWPDRIEIAYSDKLTPTRYMVTGTIIELTSIEVENGGIAASRPIVLAVEKQEDDWRITHVVLGSYEEVLPY
jgi:hypothetical protein